MKILGLDVSTKTGYAIVTDGILTSYGLLRSSAVEDLSRAEDFSFLAYAIGMSNKIKECILQHDPDMVFIEQTNQGKSRTTQKQLEYIHCMLLYTIERNFSSLVQNVQYVDTSQWRSVLSVKLSKEQRAHNKQVKQKLAKGKITSKHLAVSWANTKFALSLLQKDNDIADAIALSWYGYLYSQKPKNNLNVDIINALKTN